MTSHTSINERVAAELRAAAARNRISGADLARSLAETPIWISRRLSANVQISVEDFARLCDAIGIDPADVFTAARGDVAAPLAATP